MPGHSRAAVVRINGDSAPIMCTVNDISEGGVGLTFVSISGIPDLFMLEIKGDTEIRICKVAWRQEPHRLGIAFVAPAETAPSATPASTAPPSTAPAGRPQPRSA